MIIKYMHTIYVYVFLFLLRVDTVSNVGSALTLAARNFCENNVEVKPDNMAGKVTRVVPLLFIILTPF